MTAPSSGLPAGATSSSTRTPEMPLHPVALVVLAIVAVTLLAAIAGALMPELAPDRGPRPTLHGTPGEALSILLINVRTLSLPLLLSAGRWHTSRLTRYVGDVAVAAIVVANALLVGVALGRYPAELPRYLPHLALEDLALAVAASAWVTRRLPRRAAAGAPASVLRCALLTLTVAVLAALVEVYAVPHAS